MPLLMVNQGEDIMLQLLVNKQNTPENLVLRLYKNDKTPADGDTEASYDEANFIGYSAITLIGANWTVTPGAPTEATYSQQTFTSTADQTEQFIYGYYLTQASSGKLVWAERYDDGPYTMKINGDVIKTTPRIQAKKSGE